MLLWNKNFVLNVEDPAIADLYFEEFKSNKSFAKTTSLVLKKLNSLRQTYVDFLEDYKFAFEQIDKEDVTLSEEQLAKLFSDFSSHSSVLQRRIDYVDLLKSEVYAFFKENQTQIFKNFENDQNTFNFEQKIEIVESAKEIDSLFSKFVSTKNAFQKLLKEGNPVTEDEVMFFDAKVNKLKKEMESFPFSTGLCYDEMIASAKKIQDLKFEDEKE